MSFAVWTPTPPERDLRTLGDGERRIFFEGKFTRAVWSLKAIQEALMTEPKLPVIFTPKAHAQAYDRLGWKTAELRGYLSALSSGRYYCSEWCYTPGHNIPHACDAYIMGFNRITGKESPHFHPWVYVKFGLIGPDFKKLAVFSAHPEGQYQEE